MSDMQKPSTKERASVDAIFLNARLVSETVTSAPARLAPPNVRNQIQLTTETGSGFSLALDNVANPTVLLVQIDYKVAHKTLEDGRELVKYEATHAAQFKIVAKQGFDSWLSPPNVALGPYLSMVQSIAMKRADHTFLDMGFSGVILPIPTEFSDPAMSELPAAVSQ